MAAIALGIDSNGLTHVIEWTRTWSTNLCAVIEYVDRNGLPTMRRAVWAPCRHSRSSGYPHFFFQPLAARGLSGSRSIHLIITGRHRELWDLCGWVPARGGRWHGKMAWLVAGVGGQSRPIHNRNPDVQPRRAALPPSDKLRYLAARISHVVPEVLALALALRRCRIYLITSINSPLLQIRREPSMGTYSKLKTNREAGYVCIQSNPDKLFFSFSFGGTGRFMLLSSSPPPACPAVRT